MTAKLDHSKAAHHYIDGEWRAGEGSILISKNPADGSMVWQGSKATNAEVEAAYHAAERALPYWSSLRFAERADYIQRFAKEVEIRRQELAYLIALESGKPMWEALTEVAAVIGKVGLSIQAYQERTGEKQSETPDAKASLRFKPHGIVAVLGAFNFPAHLSNGHIVPALLAGNTVVYKPSELTPAVAQLIIQCWHECGLPHGVINCIQGDAGTGRALLSTNIQGVYFTGSYLTGKKIHQQFADRPEVIQALEMGGNNPLIIDEVNNLDAAVYYALLSTMITAGQRCTCARRLLVADNAAGDRFMDAFTKACQRLKIGLFNENPEPFMGPVISYEHAINHLDAQKELLHQGGKSLLPMELLAEDTGFLSPGIIDMTGIASAVDEEIFGPLVQVYRYQDFNQALVLANQTRFGLAAGLISDNEAKYKHFYHSIKAGLINWNRPTTGAVSSLPFGGVGRSGNHRPSGYFAADYCAYPIASLEQPLLTIPAQLLPGIDLV